MALTERKKTDAGTQERPAQQTVVREDPDPEPPAPAKDADDDADHDPGGPQEADAPEPDAHDPRDESSRFPIIGIGASAGGLEALEHFLRALPADSDAACIVVHHQDPNRKDLLVELLRRVTELEVLEATDGLRVEPRHVYVSAPGKDLSLSHGTLHLLPRSTPHSSTMPIDVFFRSLANDQGARSIGVILSGMGSDGTLGLRAIKEAAGASFVQDPASAKFDGMPGSASAAGLADVIAPVHELPARILSYRDHENAPVGSQPTDGIERMIDSICALLREYSGNDFSVYKRSTLHRRIERRMALHQLRDHAQYLQLLREHRNELDVLFNDLLIGVTSFFRDPVEWDRLVRDVVPGIARQRVPGGVLRAWVPGCSTGEEAYSLAMVLREAVEPLHTLRSTTIQIFATDLDRHAIEKARAGVYAENIAADISPERLRRFFTREDRGYRISQDIRDSVVFAPQNIIVDPPFTKMDIVSCRNLMIYLSADVQRRLMPLFHYCLNPGGVLFLGTAETVGTFHNLFTALDGRTRIFRRVDQPIGAPYDLQLSFGQTLSMPEERGGSRSAKPSTPNVQAVVDRLLVQRFAPLAVLCNNKGDVLYISGRAGKYLEPAVGKPNLNIFAMAREGLRYDLSRAFAGALREDRMITVNNVELGSDPTQLVNLSIQRLTEPRDLEGTVIVLFRDVDPEPATPMKDKAARSGGARMKELEEDLQRSREQMQTMREEMQSSQEELKSTNEELQSTNEELQSTNEELTTSKEEMQSLNEELQTVNHELQFKVDELSRSNNDMKNLLNSTDIATLFLDASLRVRRFTTATARIIKLIPADIGRPMTDIASDLQYPELADDAREVLRTLMFHERQAVARDGRSYAVRIMPYRTVDNVIDGVVITFTNTTALRSFEIAARQQADQLRQMAESLPHLVFGARADGGFDFLSRQWVEYTGIPDVEQLQWGWLDQLHPDDRERVREHWRAAIRDGASFDCELRIRNRTGAYRWFQTRATPTREAEGSVVRWYGSATDIDPLKRAEERLAGVLASIRDAVIEIDRDRTVVAINPIAETVLGARVPVAGALVDSVPELRPLADQLSRAPTSAELALGGTRLTAQIERDPGGGYLVFLRPGGRAIAS